MAEYAGVNLSGSSEDGTCDHGGVEPRGILEYAQPATSGSYPYEPTIRVYAVFSSAPDVQEDIYTSIEGVVGMYHGSVEVLSPTSVRLRVQRLGGFPKGAMQVFVERA